MPNEWISIKDRLPEANKTVLVFDDCGKVVVQGQRLERGYDTKLNWLLVPFSSVNYRTTSVSWWMPLPEKPKGKLFNYIDATVEVKGTNFHTAISDDWVRPNALIDWLNSLPLKIDESENE